FRLGFTDGTTASVQSGPVANALNTFHHVALTWDGSTLVGYVDGVVTTLVVGAKTVAYDATGLTMGARSLVNDSGAFFKGAIDEVGVYSRALSASDVQAIVTAAGAGKSTTHTMTVTNVAPSSATLTGTAQGVRGEVLSFVFTVVDASPVD